MTLPLPHADNVQDRFIASFRDSKTPRRARGILPFVTTYSSFAEQTVHAFQDSSRQNDLIIAHQKIVRELINQIDRVASESTKTPKEVIIMGEVLIYGVIVSKDDL